MGSWMQAPTFIGGEMQASGSAVEYVFGRGNGTVYIYNDQGVIATLPQSRFATQRQ